MAETVERWLYILKANLEGQWVKNVPHHLGAQGRRIPYLMSRCRREDNQVSHTLVVRVEWEFCFQHFVGVQIVPVEMRRDPTGRDECIVLLLRAKVCANTDYRPI
jgi:hypothetical protein